MYTQNRLPSDGTVGPFPIGFNYLDGDTIRAVIYDADGVSNGQTVTFTFSGTKSEAQPSGSTITLTDPVPSGKQVFIEKVIDMDTPVIVWNTGAELSQRNLRLATTNIMEMAQTAWDYAKRAYAPIQELVDLVASAGAYAVTAAQEAAAALVSETNAANSATAAANSATTAQNNAALTAADRSATLTAKTDAQTAATQAAASANNVVGNLTFGNELGARILGNFSSSTRANRVMFKTMYADSPTIVSALPSGTSVISGFSAFSSTDPDNSPSIRIRTDSGYVCLESVSSGSAASLPLSFQVGTAEVFRITPELMCIEYSPAPVVKSAAATLTVADLQAGVIQSAPAAAITLTLPTGAVLDTISANMPVNSSFDFTIVVTTAFAVTIAVATGITAIGGLTTAASSSQSYRIRKTGAGTFVIFRL